MDMARFYFPRYLNQPLMFFIFTITELVFFITPAVIGFLMQELLVGIFLGVMGVLSWRMLKKQTKGYQFLVVFFYWHLPLLSPCL